MNPLSILIVEDRLENIAAAKSMLAGHNLTVVTGFDDALTALGRNFYKKPETSKRFDVVLTDCMYPKGGRTCMNDQGEELASRQGEMPYGPLIVLHAIEAEIRHVGLITQGNHHSDPFVFAFDGLNGFKSEKVSVVVSNDWQICLHGDTLEEVSYDKPDGEKFRALEKEGKLLRVKDWKQLLERTLGTFQHPDKDKPWFKDRFVQVKI